MNDLTPNKPVIYVFSTAYDPFIGGAEIAAAEAARRLSGSFDFFVITARFNRHLPKREKKNGTTIIRVGLGFGGDKYLLPIWGTFAVLKLMRQHPPALFWAVMVTFASIVPYIVNLFRRRNKIPIVLTLQEGDPETHLRKSRLGLINLAWRLLLRRAEKVTAISSYLADLASRFGYGGEVSIIPNGVSVEKLMGRMSIEERQALRAGIGVPDGAHMIVSISRLVRKNGLDTAILSLSHLPQALREKIYLVLVGGGVEENSLKSIAKNIGAKNRVIFLGERPYDEAMKYLRAADIFVRPSRSEGMGNSFIEAMAAGIPVIGTPVGGIADFLTDRETGLVVEPDDPKAVAAAIEAFVSDAPLREHVIAIALDLASSRYRWERVAGLYHKAFASGIRRASYPRVLVVTGIYPPEIGGTASYAAKLKEILSAGEWVVEVLSFAEKSQSDGGVHPVRGSEPDLFSARESKAKPRLPSACHPNLRNYRQHILSPILLTKLGRKAYGGQALSLPCSRIKKNYLKTSNGVYRISRRFPTGIRHILAFLRALPLVCKSDAVILLDHFSMGFPVSLATFICRRPYILRIGGDFLWESHVEMKRAQITLQAFYESLRPTNKERIIFYLARFVMRGAALIAFSTEWQRRIFLSPYGIEEDRTAVLQNAVEAGTSTAHAQKTQSEIIYAGRFLFLKNLRRAMLAFREFKIAQGGALKMRLIGEGPEERQLKTLALSYGVGDYVSIEPPMPRLALMEAIKNARAVIVPSFSDISPNLALEALAAGVPAILTRHNGYGFTEADGVLPIDPLLDTSFLDAYRRIANPVTYKKLKNAAAKAVFPAWGGLGKRYEESLSRILSKSR